MWASHRQAGATALIDPFLKVVIQPFSFLLKQPPRVLQVSMASKMATLPKVALP